MSGFDGYDNWKLRTPPEYEEFEDERVSECDCCGKMKAGCVDIWFQPVGDTHVCPECRNDDEAAEREHYEQDHGDDR